jgi:hypothetical protein
MASSSEPSRTIGTRGCFHIEPQRAKIVIVFIRTGPAATAATASPTATISPMKVFEESFKTLLILLFPRIKDITLARWWVSRQGQTARDGAELDRNWRR